MQAATSSTETVVYALAKSSSIRLTEEGHTGIKRRFGADVFCTGETIILSAGLCVKEAGVPHRGRRQALEKNSAPLGEMRKGFHQGGAPAVCIRCS
jgi:hypothetical protein